jgi:hypothetical protein
LVWAPWVEPVETQPARLKMIEASWMWAARPARHHRKHSHITEKEKLKLFDRLHRILHRDRTSQTMDRNDCHLLEPRAYACSCYSVTSATFS